MPSRYLNNQMKFKLRWFLITILAVVSLLLLGCSGTNQTAVISATSYAEIEFELIDIDEITDEEVLEWFANNYYKPGMHTLDAGKRSQAFTLVLLAKGEKPTGGYEIIIEQVRGYEDKIELVALTREPQKGEFVTQSFTYPYVLLKIQQDDRNIVISTES
ncbi:protease complex subunit PrcB family protein [Desulfuribacillus alkaliarsenatis]|uniref:PrcB C-terminal domain-containing protein n=1 Tax=Desulfuribacillus alkaliarsenatis TaxID=766136 RepID=A0A1E5G4Q8_9FIRM|nr:protease complex subunit PrcB family protein [Desulfuribacillus alkaliarsenatis]OEF98156.1 hypothetical protein BHF68_00240 [Desulfuribacillus alkaliarsenatis]